MIRVGYRGYETAKLVKDKRFDNNMKNATAAGVKVGAYIVTQAVNTNEAVEEASFIISACKSYSVSLPLAIDVESAGNGTGRGDKISVSERTAVINAFVQTVKNSGYSAMVYANKDWMTNKINAGSLVQEVMSGWHNTEAAAHMEEVIRCGSLQIQARYLGLQDMWMSVRGNIKRMTNL